MLWAWLGGVRHAETINFSTATVSAASAVACMSLRYNTVTP